VNPTGPDDHDSSAQAVDSSVWAPLGRRGFRWLWVGVLISNIGTWMQTVGAQWLMVDAPNAATLVSLVPAAGALAGLLVVLPAGVLADSFDRRWLFFGVQAYLFGVGALLTVLTAAGRMPPVLLLGFTFAIGVGVAAQVPIWGSLMPAMVPRTEMRAAARLDAISVNFARSVGPALAGVVIASFGVPWVFALNAVSVVFLAIALLLWRRPPAGLERRERFLPALRAGGRYVRHEPVVRRILLRVTLFIVPGMALWALLPLVASQRLGLGAAGYGALFAALGVGAVVGGFALGPVKARLSTNGMLGLASTVFAIGLAAIAVTQSFPVALGVLVMAGVAWLAMLSTMMAELQLYLPVWVRARGLAVFMVTFFGTQAAGSVLWGAVAERTGIPTALLVSALVMLAGAAAGLVMVVPDTAHLDREPAFYWTEPRLAFDPELNAGAVLVTIEYIVSPDREPAFLAATDDLRRSRRRTGATQWGIYRDGERPDRFVEVFSVGSWDEHLRQHDGRLTAADRDAEDAVGALSDPPPRAEHLLPP
jgi:predicted MFS family arabinose efflux permease